MSALTTSPVAPTRSEHDLVAAVRAGDDRAFGELYARYGRRIVSYVFGMVGDHGRAEDIAQEVFISALRRMRDTERPIAFKPWVYEIARNACIDEFRRAKRTREVPLATDDDPESADRRLVSRTNSPETTFERRQQLDDLRGAFRGLSDNHHKLIVMRELEGLSYDEIGKRMGMTRPVVESTLFRARRRLNDEYQEIASGRRCEQVHAVIDLGAKTIQSLGIKERKRLARHVAHCQPCRRFARAEGLDDSALRAPGLVGKIAALLPIPAFLRWRRGGGGGERETASSVGSHSLGALQSVQNVAQYVDPTSPAVGLGRAAAAMAAVVVAGGGVVGGLTATSSGGKPHTSKPALVRAAPGASSGGSANQPRVGATKPHQGASTRGSNLAQRTRAKASSISSTGSTRGATGSGSASTGSNASRSAGSSSGTAAATHTGNSTGSSSSTPTLPKLPLPSTSSLPSLPAVPIPKLPPVTVPQVDVPGTVQNTLNGAGNTVGNLVNTVNGLL